MKKDFKNWHDKKTTINEVGKRPFFHEREVWWCALGTNVGFEQDGTGKNFDRPIVVIRGFSRNIFLGIALTGRKREGKYYFYLGEIEGRESSAILSQIRLIDSKRLIRKIETLGDDKFKALKDVLRKVIFD